MVGCSVIGCKSRSERKIPGITFHSFPSNPGTRAKWVSSSGKLNWTPTKRSKICSIHFDDKALIYKNKIVLLERNSVPTKHIHVLLVTSSRRPDNWIVPGGGVEPEEEPSVTAMREVLEEAGVIGKLGRCLGVFENREHKHRTEVYVMTVTQELAEWEDSRLMGRKRQWFSIDDALAQLALHKPIQRHYLQQLRRSKQKSDDPGS